MGLSKTRNRCPETLGPKWLTFLKQEKHFVKAPSVENILFTKSLSTRQRKSELSPKDRDVTNVNSQVMVVRQDLSITKKAKTTKKIVLRMECSECKFRKQVPLKRCKHFELGGDKKRKGQMIQF